MNEVTKDRIWEQRQLPEHPSQITFRGRYAHVDSRLAQLVELNKHAGDTIRILDVGCGTLSFGSPTLHDLWDVLADHGVKPEITGIDQCTPLLDFEPTYPDIRYARQLEKIQGKFDIVRILHVIEHAREEAYLALRNKIVEHLREGGILVATQKLERYNRRKEDWYLLDPTVKIAQKIGGKIRAIELLPEVSLPFWARGGIFGAVNMSEYNEHRLNILDSKEDMPRQLDIGGYENVMAHLTELKTDILEEEGLFGFFNPGHFLAENHHELQEYFCDPAMVSQNFWETRTG